MLSDSQAVAMIPVSDLGGARWFYVDTLGLTVAEERESEIQFECGLGTSFGVFVSQGKASGTHTQMVFLCQDIEAEITDLRARGVRFEDVEMPGVEHRDGIYELDGERGAWFRDPEGNLFAVAELT